MTTQNMQNGACVKINSAKTAIQGREHELLTPLGIGWPAAGKAHINCPFPDHDDKHPSWRWDAGKARWFCSCGSGDVFDAMQRLRGWDYAKACAHIETTFLSAGAASPFKEKRIERPTGGRTATNAVRQWESAAPVSDLGERYLRDVRGVELENWPASIRYCSALSHRGEGGAHSHHPAIIAGMSREPGGAVLAIGRIWLAEDGYGKADVKPNKAALGSIKGLACWFGTLGPRLVVTGGIEDAMSALNGGATFVCAAFTEPNIANIRPPACVKEIVVFGDRSAISGAIDNTGANAVARARPAWEAAGVTVRAVVANAPHKDANDVLRAEGPEAVRAIIDGTNGIALGERGEAADPRGHDAATEKNGAESSGPQNGEPQAEGDRRAALEAAVAELAKIAPVEFTLMKGERAKELGVSKADLTRLVNAERKARDKKERARRVAGGLDWPVTKDNGKPHKRSQENIQFFFDQAAIDLSFDLMANAVRINRGGESLELTDPVAKRVWLEADELGMHADEGYFMAILENTARQNSFHPLRDYLDALEWDGVPRLDTWLTDYMGAEDTELHRAFGRKHLIGAVRRIQKPGSKYDTILIFQGIQGQGKSSFVRALCPRDDYFSDAMKIGADIKEVMEVCSGKWLIEIPELDGMGRKDAASIKAMLSRQTDEARMAYGRYKTRTPRQFVMFGSVNDTHFLQDTTGNRRFWPVTVKPTEDAEAIVARLTANRDQLWAEAAHYESQGEPVVLQKRLWEAAAKAQQARMVVDPWAEKLEPYLTAHPGFVQTEAIYDTLGVSGEKQNILSHKRISGILSGLGYERVQRRVNGVRAWGYANCNDAHYQE